MASVTFLTALNSTPYFEMFDLHSEKNPNSKVPVGNKNTSGDNIKLHNHIIPKLPMYTEHKPSS